MLNRVVDWAANGITPAIGKVQMMSKQPPTGHKHKWVRRNLPADKPLHNDRYDGSKKGKQITGFMCHCGARNYTDLTEKP